MSDWTIGSLFNNRYQLDGELGRGGMGVVYSAYDTLLERKVAVKILSNPDISRDGQVRLLHEAQSAARLNHTNIVSIYDAGQAEGTFFIIMEYLEGQSLHEKKPGSLEETIQIIHQICNALEHAHTHGIIHRDLKPENVIVSGAGVAKLTDFGLARSFASRMTAEGAFIGTIFYIAPEQALGQDIDGRADLYSLGAMFYELVTGRLPFTAEDTLAVISQHLYAPVIPPSTYNPGLPPALDQLIVRLLSKSREDRPASAADVRIALDTIALEEATARPVTGLNQLVRGRLVGREQEMTQAKMAWRQAMAGLNPIPVLMISGEPGVGKTPFVREIKALAEVTGGIVMSGECYLEVNTPYAPIIQIIREALNIPGIELSDYVIADLFTLAPDLHTRYPQVTPNQALDPLSQQGRLFESFVNLCSTVASTRPLLILIEDIQWGDAGTLHMLRHLARRSRSAHLRLLLLTTYREGDWEDTCCLPEVLLDFSREQLASQIRLGQYDREQTHQFLNVMFQEEIPADFVDAIYDETEGNQFFIEEICKALIEQGKVYRDSGRWIFHEVGEVDLPQSVRLTIQARLNKINDQSLEVMRLAAVIGREFDYKTLQLACELDEEIIIDTLETAERAQLIEEIKPSRLSRAKKEGEKFLFANALIAATLREGISGLRRARLHRRVANAIEHLHPEDYASLAYHYEQAGMLQPAHENYLLAGDHALGVYANHEAERNYRAAQDLIEEDRDRAHLLSGLGEAIFRQGLYTQAIQSWIEAIELFKATGDFDNAARLYGRSARAAWYGGDPARGLALCREGMAAMPSDFESPGMAALLHETARACFFNALPEEARQLSEQALELAKRLNLIEVQADTLSTMGILPDQNLEQKRNYLTQAVQLAESAGLLATASRAHLNLGGRLQEAGELVSARAHFLQAYELARKMGHLVWAHDYLCTATEVSLSLGDFATVDRNIAQIKNDMRYISHYEIGRRYTDLIEARLFRYRGLWEQGENLTRKILEEAILAEEKVNKLVALVVLADILTEVGQLEEAGRLLDQAVRESDEPWNNDSISPRFLRFLVSIREKDMTKAVELLTQIHGLLPSQPGKVNELLIRQAEAEVADLEKKWDEADRNYQIAITLAQEMSMRWFQARVQIEWANSYLARGGPENIQNARRYYQEILSIFEALNAEGYVAMVQNVLSNLKNH